MRGSFGSDHSFSNYYRRLCDPTSDCVLGNYVHVQVVQSG